MRRSLPLLLCGALAAAALTALGAAPASAATAVPGDPLAGSGAVTRSVLTAAQLASSSTPSATVSNDAFALPANGRRAVPPLRRDAHPERHRDRRRFPEGEGLGELRRRGGPQAPATVLRAARAERQPSRAGSPRTAVHRQSGVEPRGGRGPSVERGRRRRPDPRLPALRPGRAQCELRAQRRALVPVHDDDGLAGAVPGDERDLRVLPVRRLGPGRRELHARRHRGCRGHPLGVCRRGGRPPADQADRGARDRPPGHRGEHRGIRLRDHAERAEHLRLRLRRGELRRRLPDPAGAYPFCGQLLLPSYSTAEVDVRRHGPHAAAQNYGPPSRTRPSRATSPRRTAPHGTA